MRSKLRKAVDLPCQFPAHQKDHTPHNQAESWTPCMPAGKRSPSQSPIWVFCKNKNKYLSKNMNNKTLKSSQIWAIILLQQINILYENCYWSNQANNRLFHVLWISPEMDDFSQYFVLMLNLAQMSIIIQVAGVLAVPHPDSFRLKLELEVRHSTSKYRQKQA